MVKISVITLIGMCISELMISNVGGSASTFAGGINLLSYAMTSFNIFVGLKKNRSLLIQVGFE